MGWSHGGWTIMDALALRPGAEMARATRIDDLPAEPLEGSLHFAHSDLSGLALFEEASHHGVRAAEAVLEGLRRPFDSWLQS